MSRSSRPQRRATHGLSTPFASLIYTTQERRARGARSHQKKFIEFSLWSQFFDFFHLVSRYKLRQRSFSFLTKKKQPKRSLVNRSRLTASCESERPSRHSNQLVVVDCWSNKTENCVHLNPVNSGMRKGKLRSSSIDSSLSLVRFSPMGTLHFN